MLEVYGDVKEVIERLRTKFPRYKIVLAHGCNCFNTMGAGIASRIKELWPQAYEVDLQTNKGDINKLGSFSSVEIDEYFHIANLYTQYRYGYASRHANYIAIKSAFLKVKEHFDSDTTIFVLPKYIACGHAGGDIKIVGPIIDECFNISNYCLFDLRPEGDTNVPV